MSVKKFDVIIFGATGYIGKCAILHAITVLEGLRWAVAGKSERKVQLVLAEISLKTGQNLKKVPIFLANALDIVKLEMIASKCKVLVNCCGPYQLLAERILTTCIIKGTHYVDMCNDPYFNELMELKYHERALQHEVIVISSCGFHSFPIETAINFIMQRFEGTLNSVETFVRYNVGYYFYFPLHAIWSRTAWLSLLWSCIKVADLSVIRNQLRVKRMPCLFPKLPIEELSHRAKYHEDGVMVHFPFVDQQAIERSQYILYARDKKRPIQFCKYIEFPSYIWAFGFIIWCLILSVLTQFERTRKILREFPRLFSIGMFSNEGPIPYLLEMSSFKIKMCAKGWSGPSTGRSPHNVNTIVARCMDIEISGENPFYGCACVCLLMSAKIILENHDKLPGKGGVYGPGYAFKDIQVIQNFQKFPNYLRIRVL